jgi:hypothetical protein
MFSSFASVWYAIIIIIIINRYYAGFFQLYS